MITVFLSGRLGNILFQYAAGRQLADRNGTSLRLDFSENYQRADRFAWKNEAALRSLSLRAEIRNPFPLTFIKKILQRAGLRTLAYIPGVFFQEGFSFNPKVLQLGDGAVLRGYFQSEKYFHPIRETIRKELRLRQEPCTPDFLAYRDRIRESNSVSLHIRRGDYLRYDVHNLLGLSYYLRAAAYYRERLENVRFYIFSDDLVWSRRNIAWEDVVFVDLRDSSRRPMESIELMRTCRNHIIANSTFSWWGAWLNDRPGKTVLAPDYWIRTSDDQRNRRILEDIYPSDWVRISIA
jgi:hypothetical protein